MPLLGILAAANHSEASGQTTTTAGPRTSADKLAPLIDYHVHLLGPYALPVELRLEPVQVAADVQALLDRRAALYGQPLTVEKLEVVYSPNALLLDDQIFKRWMGDKEEFARFFGLFEGWENMRLVPHRVATSGNTGYIAGTIRSADGATVARNFLLALERDPVRHWKIASESTTTKAPPPYTQPITADRIIDSMDKGGIRRALVLSEAFWIGGPGGERTQRFTPAPNKVAAVRLENDWAAAQVARFPDRLSLACGVNPLEDYALAELRRCVEVLRANAVKMNVSGGGDNMDFGDAADVGKLRTFFAAADRLRMPIVIHLGSKGGFGRKEARLFLDQIMSAAPNIPVQIAHLSSGLQQPEALRELAEARAANSPLAANLYFDLSVGSFADLPVQQGNFLADMIRKIGLEHVLYASDELPGDHHAPTWKHWAEMRQNLPLTEEEFAAIADNITPYMRPR